MLPLNCPLSLKAERQHFYVRTIESCPKQLNFIIPSLFNVVHLLPKDAKSFHSNSFSKLASFFGTKNCLPVFSSEQFAPCSFVIVKRKISEFAVLACAESKIKIFLCPLRLAEL